MLDTDLDTMVKNELSAFPWTGDKCHSQFVTKGDLHTAMVSKGVDQTGGSH